MSHIDVDKNSSDKPFHPPENKKGLGLGGKVFSIATSVVATPLSMVHGFGATIWNIGKLIKATHNEQKTKGLESTSPHTELTDKKVDTIFVKSSPFDPGKAGSVKNAVHSVIVSVLRMVPLLGMQLAEHYSRTGGFKGFENTPALTSFLDSHGLSVTGVIYNAGHRGTLKPDVKKFKEELAKSGVKDIRDLEIPLGKTGKTLEANLVIHPSNTESGPTVVMFHGNAMTRTQCQPMPFLARAYNTLNSDYPGDFNSGKPDDCNENTMREAANGIIDALVQKGVTEIAVYGISLGGAQSAIFIEQLAKRQSEAKEGDPIKKIKVPFVLLDQTFTKSKAVVENTTRNVLDGFNLFKWLRVRDISPIDVSVGISVEQENQLGYLVDEKHDGLDTEEKLKSLKKTDGFKETKFIVVGTKSDAIMGSKNTQHEYDPKKNFSHDLALALTENFEKSQIEHFMIESYKNNKGVKEDAGHCTPFYIRQGITINGEEQLENPILDAIPKNSKQ